MVKNTNISVLVAEDDPDDRLLLTEAFEDSALNCQLSFVQDGEELLDYLDRVKSGQAGDGKVWPSLILLDLNMPKIDGRQALIAIKTDPELRQIPVVILTTSLEKDDVLESYLSGTNSFIVKPSSFSGLRDVVASIESYWLGTAELPNKS